MFKWTDRITPIREPILWRLPNFEFIPRQLEAVWAGELAQQWGQWEIPPVMAPEPDPEQADNPAPIEAPIEDEIPVDADIIDDNIESENESSLTG